MSLSAALARRVENLRYLRSRWPILGRMRRLESLIAGFEPHEGLSLFPTQTAWAASWKSRPSRVLLVAPRDFSGSLFKWAQAINGHGTWSARMVTFSRHRYGYDTDIVVPREIPGSLEGPVARIEDAVLRLVAEADVVHFKDEQELFHESRRPPRRPSLLAQIHDRAREAGKPIGFTAYGGYARKYKNDTAYREFVRSFGFRVAMTPDLNYDWFDGRYIPHSIDLGAYPRAWKDGKVVSHSPSVEARKGTEALRSAMAAMPGFELDIIQGISHDECIARKRHATLFFDQAGRERAREMGTNEAIGWYGNSAIEAMAFGIPTLAHLSDAAFEGAARAGKDIRGECPVIDVGCDDPESIQSAIEAFFSATTDARRELSDRTRAWVEHFHSNTVVGKELVKVYEEALAERRGSD